MNNLQVWVSTWSRGPVPGLHLVSEKPLKGRNEGLNNGSYSADLNIASCQQHNILPNWCKCLCHWSSKPWRLCSLTVRHVSWEQKLTWGTYLHLVWLSTMPSDTSTHSPTPHHLPHISPEKASSILHLWGCGKDWQHAEYTSWKSFIPPTTSAIVGGVAGAVVGYLTILFKSGCNWERSIASG